MSNFEKRRDNLRRLMRKQQLPALLVTSVPNVTYLTGFTGDSSYLLLTEREEVLLSDFRFITQIEQECPGLTMEIRPRTVSQAEAVGKLAKQFKLSRMGVESASLSVKQYEAFREKMAEVELVSTSDLVETLREVKEKGEVELIRQAIRIAERAIEVVRASLTPQSTEKELADMIDHQIRLFGGTGCSFPPIVGVGPTAALPHATPGSARVEESGLLLIDWGARAEQYISDLTRTFATAKISPKLERIYGLVFTAQQRAIEQIRPGALLREVDAAARKVIAAGGHDKHFGHGLGHGIGLQVHEAPGITSQGDKTLKAGMVITVEPGIYLPGWGGIRIEDDILVTRDGHEVLSSSPKLLEECLIRW